MNCRAMPETFQHSNCPLIQGTILATRTLLWNHGAKAVASLSEIFIEMLNDVARTPETGENINKSEQLHLETLVAHR